MPLTEAEHDVAELAHLHAVARESAATEATAFQTAIRGTFLMNGAAIVSLLTFLGSAGGSQRVVGNEAALYSALGGFTNGLAAAALAGIAVYLRSGSTSRLAEYALRKLAPNLSDRTPDRGGLALLLFFQLMEIVGLALALLSLMLSLAAFVEGSKSALDAVKPAQVAVHSSKAANSPGTPPVKPAVKPPA